MVDLNGDGHDDIISGSYWPGTIYVFDGTGKGEYAKGRALTDASGRELNPGPEWESEDEPQMQSLASVPFAYDYDADGDFDLISGNIEGGVILIENVGTAHAPKFSADRVRIQANGADLMVNMGDSGPVVADWDTDGKPDLIVGAGDGSVTWFRNTGSRTVPVYAEGVELIDAMPMEGDGSNYMLEPGQQPDRAGTRTKVCVTDYNRDGLIDLLVGDVRYQSRPEPDLTDEQIELRDRLQARLDELNAAIGALYEAEAAKANAEGNVNAPIRIEPDDERVADLYGEMGELSDQLAPLQAGMDIHGWVWYYQRKPADNDVSPKTAQVGMGAGG
ncbi:MAG: VCBS repeat-containing protein [Planctomycetes bacterium]|nr:VCBS repeat-containing protein [Planctomycetota bacterium]